MILEMFSVYDKAIKAYMQPFFFRTKGESIRALRDTINGGESNLAKHPEDYDLYHMATFDESTGLLTPQSDPVLVIKSTDLLELK